MEHVFLSCHQNAGQNHKIRRANKFFGGVAKFNDLVMTVVNHNDILNEIKSCLNLGSTCYHSIQNILSSCLLRN
jgi:hypothetical protein